MRKLGDLQIKFQELRSRKKKMPGGDLAESALEGGEGSLEQ